MQNKPQDEALPPLIKTAPEQNPTSGISLPPPLTSQEEVLPPLIDAGTEEEAPPPVISPSVYQEPPLVLPVPAPEAVHAPLPPLAVPPPPPFAPRPVAAPPAPAPLPAKQAEPVVEAQIQEPPVPSAPEAGEEKAKGGSKLWLWLVLAFVGFVLLVLLAVGAYFFFGSEKVVVVKDSETNAPAQDPYATRDKPQQVRNQMPKEFAAYYKAELFIGTAKGKGTGATLPLSLELRQYIKDGPVTAWLRNDGGWSEARHFSVQEEANGILYLSTMPSDMVPLAGPFLDVTEGWTIKAVRSGGKLMGETDSYIYSFNQVPLERCGALIAETTASFIQFREFVRTEVNFEGTIADRATGRKIAVELVFGDFGDGGNECRAVMRSLESVTASRHLKGSFLANKYRAEGEPLRLSTVDDPSMPSEELPLIGTRGSMTLRLHVDRRVLLGGDGRFIFEARPVRDLRQSKPVKISVSG